jgi:pimeloyl-ACP methyl ester carboxylesterase
VPTVDVNGLRMYYEMRGDGPPLVLILGLAADVAEFSRVIDALAEHFRVLAFDNRGAGRTDKPDEPYTVEMMADDTIGLMSATGVERAHVVAISLGGRIAIELASRRPDLVDRLALVSTAAKVRHNLRRGFVMGVLSRVLTAGRDRQPRYAFGRQLDASGSYDGTAKLASIKAPTKVFHGRADRTAPYDLAVAMRDGIPGASMETFRGGHLFFLLAQRQRFAAELTAFLNPA